MYGQCTGVCTGLPYTLFCIAMKAKRWLKRTRMTYYLSSWRVSYERQLLCCALTIGTCFRDSTVLHPRYLCSTFAMVASYIRGCMKLYPRMYDPLSANVCWYIRECKTALFDAATAKYFATTFLRGKLSSKKHSALTRTSAYNDPRKWTESVYTTSPHTLCTLFIHVTVWYLYQIV